MYIYSQREVVLLDTRNVYESNIGRFEVPGVRTLEAATRQFTTYFPYFTTYIYTYNIEMPGVRTLEAATRQFTCSKVSKVSSKVTLRCLHPRSRLLPGSLHFFLFFLFSPFFFVCTHWPRATKLSTRIFRYFFSKMFYFIF